MQENETIKMKVYFFVTLLKSGNTLIHSFPVAACMKFKLIPFNGIQFFYRGHYFLLFP